MKGIKPQGKPWTQEANSQNPPRGLPRGIPLIKNLESIFQN